PPTNPAMNEPAKGIQKSRISSTNIQRIAAPMLPRLVGWPIGWPIVEVATGCSLKFCNDKGQRPFRSAPSLVTQSGDRVEASGAAGGPHTEDDPDARRESERRRDRGWTHRRVPAERLSQHA